MFEGVCEGIISNIAKAGTTAIWWLGQSGYVLKNSYNEIIYIDPYLTDTISSGYRPYIHARIIPPVIEPNADIEIMGVLLTHDHQDHLDPNTLVILAESEYTSFIGSIDVCNKLVKVLDIPKERVIIAKEWDKITLGHYDITAVKAVHCGGAVGFIVETEGNIFYFSGDTVLFHGMKEIGDQFDIDMAFLCFNGQGGNMDIRAALHAVKLLDAKSVVPCHYGMYADNTADPERFAYFFRLRYIDKKYIIMEPGKKYYLNKVT